VSFCPARFFASSGPATNKINTGGEKDRELTGSIQRKEENQMKKMKKVCAVFLGLVGGLLTPTLGHSLRKSVMIAAFFVLAFATPAWAHERGRMTGGGSIQCGDFGRVTHGFELHCIGDDGVLIEPNNLEINWGGGNNFHLTTLTTSVCSDSPVIQQPPSAPFDTMEGTGTGTFNNEPGATIQFILIDAGEPGGGVDMARYFITDASGNVVLDCPLQVLDQGGNHQAHKANP
jgi:hypothetical protein